MSTDDVPAPTTAAIGAPIRGRDGAGVPVPRGAGSGAREERALDLLLLGSPREVLARILPDDPLELRRRLAARLRVRSLLLDAERVLLRVFALVAYRAGAWRGRPELADWLGARIDEAIEAVLGEEDGSAPGTAVRSEGTSREQRDVFSLLASPLGLAPGELRGACARFNRLSASEREAFFLLVIEGESLDSACARRSIGASELARSARRALDVLRGPAALPPAPGGDPGRSPSPRARP